MRILSLETSCDETAAAIVEDGTTVLSTVIATQQQDFADRGGVIPEQAARAQMELVLPVVAQAMNEANVDWDDIDAIAVTKGPGLLVSLVVGTTVARTLASVHGKPLIGVHHTLGHLSSTFLKEADSEVDSGKRIVDSKNNHYPLSTIHFPLLTLSASGGHTDFWYRESHTKGTLLGRTRDDAAGEAFDKGAAMLGLPYPGGPSISKAAEDGDPTAFDFPLPLRDDDSLDFSFSGLKTSLKYTLQNSQFSILNSQLCSDLAASYQQALCTHLLDRIKKAVKEYPDAKEIHIVGGVSANTHLRHMTEADSSLSTIHYPLSSFCTDNAAMIGAAAYFMIEELGERAYEGFETEASLPLETVICKQ